LREKRSQGVGGLSPSVVQKMKKSNIVARKDGSCRFPFLSDSHIPNHEHKVGKAGSDMGFTEHGRTTSPRKGKGRARKKLGDELGLWARRPSPENGAGKISGFVVYNGNHH